VTGFVSAARENGVLRETVLTAVLVAVAFRFVLGESWATTTVLVGGVSVASLVTEYADYRGVTAAARHLAFGGLLVLVGGGWLAASLADPPALAVTGLVAGAWLVLDGWTARRYGLPAASEPPGDEFADEFDRGFVENVRAFHDLGAVGRAIDDGSRTPPEIAARLDRPEREVREELDRLQRADVVERVDGEYRLTGPDWRVRSWPGRAARRLVRPVALLAGSR
jgi:hypothetical protein